MKTLETLRRDYKTYKAFLDTNRTKYQEADKIVTEGIVDPHNTMSVELMDKVYAQASMFYMKYELVKSLASQLEDLGVQYTTGN
jgi:hypothetical protein